VRLTILCCTLLALFCGSVLIVGAVLVAPAPATIPESSLTLPHEQVEFAGASGGLLRGWYIPAQSDSPGTVVLMHGVRSNRLSMVGRAEMLHRAGYSVLLFDFQAHGESEGRRITLGHLESGDARAAVAYARSRAPGRFVGAIGVSLGGAAALLGNNPLPVDALVLEAVYPDIEAGVENRLRIRFGSFGRFLSPLLLLQLRPRLGIGPEDLAPIAAISRVQAPLLIIGGAVDRHTTSEDTARLFAAAPQPKQLWVIGDAAHVDFEAFAGELYAERVLSFFKAAAALR
jgi:uncharacterized protein